jgi:hypothetical protein
MNWRIPVPAYPAVGLADFEWWYPGISRTEAGFAWYNFLLQLVQPF